MSVRCLAACAMTFLLAGCESLYSVSASVGSGIASAASWAPTFLGPYRPDVHQGNIVSQEMVDQLRIGMTRDQVRFMLGTPLMTSEFRKDRIDYVYYLNPRRGPIQNRRLTLFFKENRLERFENDPMPSEDEIDALILGPNVKRVARVNRQPEIPMPDVSTPAPGTGSN
jgi:outer membrane protein assembly factor BamE